MSPLAPLYSSPSILQPSILRPPLIIRPLDLVPKANIWVLKDLYFKTTCNIRQLRDHIFLVPWVVLN